MSDTAKFALMLAGGVLVLAAAVVSFVIMLSDSDSPMRRALLYDNNGKILREYNGKITHIFRHNNGTRFRVDGKRVIIRGGITVIEEE